MDINGNDNGAYLAKNFEEMNSSGKPFFFGEDDLADVFDHYLIHEKLGEAQKLLNYFEIRYPYSNLFRIRKASLLLLKGELDSAEKYIKEAYEIDLQNPEIFLLHAELCSQRNKFDEMELYLDKANNLAEGNSDVLIGIAYIYINSYRYEKAAVILERIIKNEPENEPALFELAGCYLESGRYNDAIRIFNKYLDIDPYSAWGWFNLGMACSATQKSLKAIDAYDFAIAIDEKFSTAYFNRGIIKYDIEKYEEALKDFEKVIELEGPDVYTLCRIGDTYYMMMEYSWAAKAYRKAEKINTVNSGEPWYGLGMVHNILGEFDEGEICLYKAIKFEPDNIDFIQALANFKFEKYEFDEARIYFSQSLIIDPEYTEARLNLGDCFYHTGHTRNAMELMIEGIKLQPNEYHYLVQLAIYYFLQKDKDKFQQLLHEAFQIKKFTLQDLFELHHLLDADLILQKSIQKEINKFN